MSEASNTPSIPPSGLSDAKALEMAQELVSQGRGYGTWENRLARALIGVAQERDDAIAAVVSERVERRKVERLLQRFLEWDALTVLPDPLPAPFGDLHYWLGEFRSAAEESRLQPEWKPQEC